MSGNDIEIWLQLIITALHYILLFLFSIILASVMQYSLVLRWNVKNDKGEVQILVRTDNWKKTFDQKL